MMINYNQIYRKIHKIAKRQIQWNKFPPIEKRYLKNSEALMFTFLYQIFKEWINLVPMRLCLKPLVMHSRLLSLWIWNCNDPANRNRDFCWFFLWIRPMKRKRRTGLVNFKPHTSKTNAANPFFVCVLCMLLRDESKAIIRMAPSFSLTGFSKSTTIWPVFPLKPTKFATKIYKFCQCIFSRPRSCN